MISVTLPMRLPSVANLREHWATKAKRTKAHRNAGRLAWQQLLCAGVLPVACWSPLVVILTRVSPRRLDDDNLASAFKAFRDGLADGMKPLGVVDDRDPRVRWVYSQEFGAAVVRVSMSVN
jgi:hypothetical protein